MKTFLCSVAVAFALSFMPVSASVKKTERQNPRPTKLARYQMGTYVSMDSTRLRVNVNKELGGEVTVRLIDVNGNMLFEQAMGQSDTSLRLSLNISELSTGDYTLKVSNGLEIMVREFKIIHKLPKPTSRTITVL